MLDELLKLTPSLVQTFGLLTGIIAMIFGLYTIRISRKGVEEIRKEIESSTESVKTTLFDDVTRKIFDKLKENRSLADRMTSVAVEEKRELGSLLADPDGTIMKDPEAPDKNLMEMMITNTLARSSNGQERKSLFIESGSTLAYLGNAISECSYIEADSQDSLRVTTNNILVDQTFVFKPNVSVHLLEGTPIGRYGATFGEGTPDIEPDGIIRVWRSVDSKRPIAKILSSYDNANFYIGSQEQYAQMGRDIQGYFKNYGPPEYLLMTSPNLSLEDGPHVGSFQNRDFKENMYHYAVAHTIPYIMIIYDHKIHPDPMDNNACLSVFGKDAVKFDAEEVVPSSAFGLGIFRFAGAISRGEITLIITKKDRPTNNIGGDTKTQAGNLFTKLLQISEATDTGYAIQAHESPDRRIRVLAAHRGSLHRQVGESNAYTEFIDSLRLAAFKFNRISIKR